MFQFADRIPSSIRDNVTNALLDWEYWMDEANVAGGYFQGGMMMWTENHQMSFHTSEYLVGCLFPDQLFPGTNMTGTQHREKGRKFVMEWMQRRFAWGFSEFKSEVYLQFDVLNLANLAAVAPDEDVRIRAQMIIDLLLYDISIHNHKGMIATARGRSYGADKFSITTQSIAPLVHLLTGRGFTSPGSGEALVIALSALLDVGYTVPDCVLRIASFDGEMEIRERIGLSPSEKDIAAQTGLGYTDPNDGLAWWGDGAYAHPDTIPLLFQMGDQWHLWGSNETTWSKKLQPFSPLKDTTFLKNLMTFFSPLTEGPVLGPAYSYTYRTPQTTLSSALDYNKGQIGTQQHAWQATLNGSALVFTTAPGPFNKNEALSQYVDEMLVKFWLSTAQLDVPKNVSVTDTKALLMALLTPILGDNHDADYADGNWTGSSNMPR